MDEWGVDVLVTGSQKALMLPPGLGILALSPRAWEVAQKNRTPRFYFDLQRELKAQRDEHTTAWTPSVSLIFGLNRTLELLHARGLAAGLRPPSPDGRGDACRRPRAGTQTDRTRCARPRRHRHPHA